MAQWEKKWYVAVRLRLYLPNIKTPYYQMIFIVFTHMYISNSSNLLSRSETHLPVSCLLVCLNIMSNFSFNRNTFFVRRRHFMYCNWGPLEHQTIVQNTEANAAFPVMEVVCCLIHFASKINNNLVFIVLLRSLFPL